LHNVFPISLSREKVGRGFVTIARLVESSPSPLLFTKEGELLRTLPKKAGRKAKVFPGASLLFFLKIP